jgi:hypothetical protein
LTAKVTPNSDQLEFAQSDVLARVRELDPDCNVEIVARFVREIDAATAVLQRVDATNLPLPVAFDSRWPQDRQR